MQPPLSDETGDGGNDSEDEKKENEFSHERIGGFYGIIGKKKEQAAGRRLTEAQPFGKTRAVELRTGLGGYELGG